MVCLPGTYECILSSDTWIARNDKLHQMPNLFFCVKCGTVQLLSRLFAICLLLLSTSDLKVGRFTEEISSLVSQLQRRWSSLTLQCVFILIISGLILSRCITIQVNSQPFPWLTIRMSKFKGCRPNRHTFLVCQASVTPKKTRSSNPSSDSNFDGTRQCAVARLTTAPKILWPYVVLCQPHFKLLVTASFSTRIVNFVVNEICASYSDHALNLNVFFLSYVYNCLPHSSVFYSVP